MRIGLRLWLMTARMIVLVWMVCGCTMLGQKQPPSIVHNVTVSFLQESYPQVIQLGTQLPPQKIRSSRYHRAFYYLGLSYLKQNDFKAARNYFELLKEQGKKVAFIDEVEFKLAESYYQEGNLEYASRLYESFIMQYPASAFLPTAYYKLGTIKQRLGKFDDAQKLLSELEITFPLSFEAKQVSKTDIKNIDSFSVQVGAFYDHENAAELVDELSERGYAASILKTERDSAIYYRVRVGSYLTRTEAEVYSRRLADEGFKTTIYP